jgi:hypothetical protein
MGYEKDFASTCCLPLHMFHTASPCPLMLCGPFVMFLIHSWSDHDDEAGAADSRPREVGRAPGPGARGKGAREYDKLIPQ